MLADGEPHSGEALARRFGVSRAAIAKHVAKLRQRWELEVRALAGVGYRLAAPIDLIDARELRAALVPVSGWRVGALEAVLELPSTNQRLLERPPPAAGVLDVCLAEFQTAGRGRRGRAWRTPLGAGVCLSVAWQFGAPPRDLAALTLAVGVVARRAIDAACGVQAALKWPNDLVWDERKLGGILLELKGEAHGGCHVVAGIGINVALPAARLAALADWPRGAVDLAAATDGAPPRRTLLAAALIRGLGELLAGYAQAGFGAYRADWRAADFLHGRTVMLDDPAGRVVGTAAGIAADGALVVATANGERHRVTAGDVSVRAP